MKLNHTTTGPESGVPIVLVHGLFGQGRNLGVIARRLGRTRRVVTVDLRNHGDSPHDPDHSYAVMAGDLAQLIADLGGPVDLAGHSMGGKAAMVLALTQPGLLRKLAVMDIAPVAYDHDQTHLIDAMQAVELDGLDRRSEADRRLAQNLNAPALRAFLLQQLDLKSDPAHWRLNLPVLRDWMDRTTGWPDDLPKATLKGPALFMAGADRIMWTARARMRSATISRRPSWCASRMPATGCTPTRPKRWPTRWPCFWATAEQRGDSRQSRRQTRIQPFCWSSSRSASDSARAASSAIASFRSAGITGTSTRAGLDCSRFRCRSAFSARSSIVA